MRITYEPGDGTFEVVLGKYEEFPDEWNILNATVLREYEPGKFQIIKHFGTIKE